MNAKDTMLCWDMDSDRVALVPWPDRVGLSERYQMSTLACWGKVQDWTFEQRKAFVFIEAMHLIIVYKVDPMAVHRALLGLDEYRDGCSAEMPGK